MTAKIWISCAILLTFPIACGSGEDGSETDSDSGSETDTDTSALEDAPIGGNHDLVDFPDGYKDGALYTTVDKVDNMQVRRFFANDTALGSPAGELDRGSTVVMEIWSALLDGDGAPVLDDHGRFVADELNIVALMEKQEGFGNYTPETANGEWEYAFFTPGGEDMSSDLDCYGCHLEMAGPGTDYVFTLNELELWQTEPAPVGGTTDLLNFPDDYLSYQYAATVDRVDNNQVRDVYANDIAVASADGDFDRGSIVVMEIYGAVLDDNDEPVLDMEGNFMKDQLSIVAVMEKQQGFGNYTPETRNDEWEYAFFAPDGTPMASEADCYGCHLENAGASVDFVFSKAEIAALQ